MDFYLRWVMLGYPAQLKNSTRKLKSLVVSTAASHLLQSVLQQGIAQLHAELRRIEGGLGSRQFINPRQISHGTFEFATFAQNLC